MIDQKCSSVGTQEMLFRRSKETKLRNEMMNTVDIPNNNTLTYPDEGKRLAC